MEKIWWEQVPNSRAFADTIFDSVSEGKNTVLISKCGLPWYNFFYAKLKDCFRQRNASKVIEELSNISNPGEYLLHKYCKPEKRATYRPGKSFANFFASSEDIVIHDRLFWVRLNDDSLLDTWMTFISDYVKERGKGKKQASFLIECTTNKVINSRKGITVTSFEDSISEYDRFVFCMLAASSVNEKGNIKKYLSELISNVIGNNVELCEKVICDYRTFLSNPYSVVSKFIGDSNLFSKTENEVAHDVWLSQVRIVYPVLEDFREGFVKKHWRDISRNLPISSSSGESYAEPADVELGTLRFLADNWKITLTAEEHDVLILHTQARNDLSHLKSIDLSTVRKILE